MSEKKEAEIISKERNEQFANDPENPQQLIFIAREIEAKIQGTKKAIYEVGELLYRAKEILGHGKFKKWIKKRFTDLSYPTALNWMRVYRICLGHPSIVNSIKTSILYKIAAPSFPGNLRKHILEHGDELRTIKNEDMKKVLMRFKKGEINIKSPEIVAFFKFNRNMAIYEDYEKRIAEAIDQITKLKDEVLSMTNKFKWPIHPKEQQIILSREQWYEVKHIMTEITMGVNTLLAERSDIEIKPKFKLIKGKGE